jgi:hypothetical protein
VFMGTLKTHKRSRSSKVEQFAHNEKDGIS